MHRPAHCLTHSVAPVDGRGVEEHAHDKVHDDRPAELLQRKGVVGGVQLGRDLVDTQESVLVQPVVDHTVHQSDWQKNGHAWAVEQGHEEHHRQIGVAPAQRQVLSCREGGMGVERRSVVTGSWCVVHGT